MLDYKELKKEYWKKSKKIEREDLAKKVVQAFNKTAKKTYLNEYKQK